MCTVRRVSKPKQNRALEGALFVESFVGHPIPLPEGTRVESVDVDGIPATWISPTGADPERVVLYFHRGAYILGSLASHRELVARLSAVAGVRSLLLDYRLAPEHVFPAALDDALTERARSITFSIIDCLISQRQKIVADWCVVRVGAHNLKQ
jgi:monoterpene epsilon-lactone hydrolase